MGRKDGDTGADREVRRYSVAQKGSGNRMEVPHSHVEDKNREGYLGRE